MNRVIHSSNSSIEQCSICFEDMINQPIGIPEHCEHAFCFTCLVEWAKNVNSCPHDRAKFEYILKKHLFSHSRPYAKVNLNNTESEILLEEDVIRCHVCEEDDEEYHPLLTCTQCKNSYHEYCLNSFDITAWICPSCGYNHEDKTEPIEDLPIVRKAEIRQDGTLHVDRPRHRLQQRIPQKPIKRLGNMIIEPTRSSRTTIQTREIPKNNLSIRPFMTHAEAARRIIVSGKPIVPCPQSAALISQAQNMATLRYKRRQFARLPPKIPVNQLPRIQRRTDTPLRSHLKPIIRKSNQSSNAPFLDKLLQSQQQLYSLENIQMQGAHIKLS